MTKNIVIPKKIYIRNYKDDGFTHVYTKETKPNDDAKYDEYVSIEWLLTKFYENKLDDIKSHFVRFYLRLQDLINSGKSHKDLLEEISKILK